MTNVEEFIKEYLKYNNGTLVWRKWYNQNRPGTKAANSHTEYKVVAFSLDGKRHTLREHRIIYWLHYGCWPEMIDHINRKKTDNRIENLRECTNQENQRNRDNNKDYFGERNVRWDQRAGKYKVVVREEGKLRYLGGFEDYDHAVKMAKDYRRRAHGEFCSD